MPRSTDAELSMDAELSHRNYDFNVSLYTSSSLWSAFGLSIPFVLLKG